MWITKQSLYEVAGIVFVEGHMPPDFRWRRIRCRRCDSPLSFLFTGRTVRGTEDIRLVGEAYCPTCHVEPTAPPYGAPLDPTDLVKIAL